jgi:hypothetical protein
MAPYRVRVQYAPVYSGVLDFYAHSRKIVQLCRWIRSYEASIGSIIWSALYSVHCSAIQLEVSELDTLYFSPT